MKKSSDKIRTRVNSSRRGSGLTVHSGVAARNIMSPTKNSGPRPASGLMRNASSGLLNEGKPSASMGKSMVDTASVASNAPKTINPGIEVTRSFNEINNGDSKSTIMTRLPDASILHSASNREILNKTEYIKTKTKITPGKYEKALRRDLIRNEKVRFLGTYGFNVHGRRALTDIRKLGGMGIQALESISDSDDTGLQAVRYAARTGRLGHQITSRTINGIRTMKSEKEIRRKVRTYKHERKIVTKRQKKIWKGYRKQYIKTNGRMKYVKRSLTKKIKGIGHGIVNSIKNTLLSKKLYLVGGGLLVSLIAYMSLILVIIGCAASLFSGVFNLLNPDGSPVVTDIREYVHDRASYLIIERVLQVRDSASESGYEVIYFKNPNTDELINLTSLEEGDDLPQTLVHNFYDITSVVNLIQPIFNAKLLCDYEELSVTELQADMLLTDIVSRLFVQRETVSIGYCEVDSPCNCGICHPSDTCTNIISGTHTTYTCSLCDSTTEGATRGSLNCGTVQHSHIPWQSPENPGCYTTRYIGELSCSGFEQCGGHEALTIELTMDGIDETLNEYFEARIRELENMEVRTEEEEKELSNLKLSYSFCLELIQMINQEYGGGMTVSDLSDVEWVTGTREGNQEVVNIALGELGMAGGSKYYGYMGFSERIPWCACFVSWCMNEMGHSEINSTSCDGLISILSSQQYTHFYSVRGYADIAPGDVIFFDWGDGGITDHTGIVIGRDQNYVYTVEGNSNDQVRIKRYPLDSLSIIGYGMVDWGG